jgi:glycosyltransferase involved in cell wall biosynthesis
MTPPQEPIRIVRVIARLNIGGPAIQAITLTKRLEAYGYSTRLVRGREAPDEGNMDYLAEELGVSPTLLPTMRREPGLGDLRALASLVRILRRDRPHIVHTHAAMGGTLGRLATLIAFPVRSRRPALVHTFHGHSLTGYFSGRTARVFRNIERFLARYTDTLVAVSAEVRDDLVALGVGPADRFVVIPLGLDLAAFAEDTNRAERREALRRQWNIGGEDKVVTLVARLVPIKRVDRFLSVARVVAERTPLARFVIIGDGELRDELMASADAQALGERLVWAGFRRDMPDVCFASDVVVLTSDNEGTPVSLIEAQAAAVPVVSTDVGGVGSAILDGRTGFITSVDDRTMAEAVLVLLQDQDRADALGGAGRAHALASFSLERLVEQLDKLYRRG